MLTILNHPLINHKLTQIRKKETSTKDFRQNLEEIASLMAYEITRDLKTKQIEIETPVCKTIGEELEYKIVLVPILRAGLGMVNSIHNLIPTARIGHIGIYRDEESLKPQQYYTKLPKDISECIVFILDPMLATGNSASFAAKLIKDRGCKKVKLISIVGVDEGIAKMQKDHPDIDIILATKDLKLNENGFIVPGLGDAGDRIFGTK